MLQNKTVERCLNPWFALIDHPVHSDLIKAVSQGIRFPVCAAGRRCLAAGTYVSTPSGPVKIEDLKVGDEVIGWDGSAHITTVTNVYDNGIKDVIELINNNDVYVIATLDHKLYGTDEWSICRKKITDRRIAISDINKRNRIYRSYHIDLIRGGKKHLYNTYALGAFLSNGCIYGNKSDGLKSNNLEISDGSDVVIKKIAYDLNTTYKKNKGNNFTYTIQSDIYTIPFYKDWCHRRYSHEKIADWNEIDTWDKETSLKFLAGIIDSDGSIYYKSKKEKEAIIAISMQSFSIIDCCRKIIFKYFQEDVTYYVDRRKKYVNGYVHCIKTTSNIQVINILNSLNRYLVKCRIDVNNLSVRNTLPDRVGFLKGKTYKSNTFDITVSNNTNLYCLHKGGIVTSNSGKTIRFKRFLVKYAMIHPGSKLFIAAPTYNQVKKIYWDDIKSLSMTRLYTHRPSESDLIVYFPNDSEIHLIGLDKPERMEGISWDGGGIDEFANIKKDAWALNIFPALSTYDTAKPDYKPWCWLFGVPEGLNHFYDRAEYARTSNDPDWKFYTWKSSDILPPEVIESVKRSMSIKQFRQEFEASFETVTGRIYDDYSEKNTVNARIATHEVLHWTHDFNYSPMSSAIGVIRESKVYFLDEIVLQSAVSRQSAEEFVERYKTHDNKKVAIYGDPSGKIGEKHSHSSDYKEIESVLRAAKWTIERRVAHIHPAIKDRQNSVRSMIKNVKGDIRLFVNPNQAKYCHKGLSTVQVKEGSSFIEQESEYQHITTAIGYMIDYLYPSNENVGYAINARTY